MFWWDTQFASYLDEGSVTAIYYADRVMELVLGGYAVAVSTVILPLLSRQAALKEIDELKTTMNFAVRLILFITFPATLGLILLRVPIIEVLFEHGDFNAASTALTAWALPFFAVGLSAFSMLKIIVPAFYALKRYAHAGEGGAAALFLNIGLNFLFLHPLRNGGPALATSLSAFFNSTVLFIIFRRRYGVFGARSIAQVDEQSRGRNRRSDRGLLHSDSLARLLCRGCKAEGSGTGCSDRIQYGDIFRSSMVVKLA
jgi:putative peptidoglycan lipid II flippase